MTKEEFVALPLSTRDKVTRTLFISICDGLGDHGGFLRNYGDAIACVDYENFELLRLASEALILKYNLCRYASVIGTVVTCQEKPE